MNYPNFRMDEDLTPQQALADLPPMTHVVLIGQLEDGSEAVFASHRAGETLYLLERGKQVVAGNARQLGWTKATPTE